MSLNSRAVYWQRKPFYLDGTVAANEVQKIVWEGDSLAFATFGVSYLYSRVPTVVNLAVPGSTTALMEARAGNTTGIDNQLAANALAVIWGGPYNSLASQPNTIAGGDAAADDFFTYLDNRVAAGWGAGTTRLACMNMIRRGNAPAGYPQIAWAQCHARITAEAQDHCDFAAQEPDPPGTPGDRRNYDVDFIHLYPPGYQQVYRDVMAPFIYSVRF